MRIKKVVIVTGGNPRLRAAIMEGIGRGFRTPVQDSFCERKMSMVQDMILNVGDRTPDLFVLSEVPTHLLEFVCAQLFGTVNRVEANQNKKKFRSAPAVFITCSSFCKGDYGINHIRRVSIIDLDLCTNNFAPKTPKKKVKKMAKKHARFILGNEQYKTNKNAAKSIAADFMVGYEARLDEEKVHRDLLPF